MNTINSTPFTQCGLVLKTNSISESNTITDYPVSNSVGSINGIRNQYTWNNINLQDILGDQYHQFDYFTLVWKGIQYGPGVGVFSSTEGTRLVSVAVSGPDLRGCTYDVRTRRNNAQAVLGGLFFNTTAATFNISHDNCIATFKKSDTFNLTITLKSYTGADPAPFFVSPTLLFPQCIYFFDIVPSEFPEQEPYTQVY